MLEGAPRGGWRAGGEPRVGARLVPWLMGAMVFAVATDLDGSYQERRAQPVERTEEEVALLSSVLAVTAEDLLSQERAADLDELLGAALQADEVFAAFVLGPAGSILAGGAADLSCLPGQLPLRLGREPLKGLLDCGTGVRWSATPLPVENRWLVVGIEDVLLNRAVGDALRRQLLLLVALTVMAGSAVTFMPALRGRASLARSK